jgi:hypothetical protein
MSEYAKETGYGSFIPDFDVGLLTQKQFLAGMRGQTIHTLTKKEMKELSGMAKGIWPKIWKKRRCDFCGKWFLGWSRLKIVFPNRGPVQVSESECSKRCSKALNQAIRKALRCEKLSRSEKKATTKMRYAVIPNTKK